MTKMQSVKTIWRHINPSLGFVAAIVIALGSIVVLPQQAIAEQTNKKLIAPKGYEDVWADLHDSVFDGRDIHDGTGFISLEVPYRAHDAAIVPITISAAKAQDRGDYIKAITLIIDKNPAPVAATFGMGPDSGIATLSTRIRVNMYSWVRAIAETNDGKLYMVRSFVKAAGGCSAPAGKDQAEAIASMGKMKLRQFSPVPAKGENQSLVREAQLMIRHPNHSGLAMDQVTGLFIPAHFVQKIEVKRGDKPILSVEGAISISEDPSIRFHFVGDDDEKITAHVVDTEGKEFTKTWTVKTPVKQGS